MKKIFEWQYSWEKILLRVRPNLVYFFFQKIYLFLIYLFLIWICIAISLTIPVISVYFYIFVFILFAIYIFTFYKLFTNCRYTITSRRCIFYVQKNFFKKSYNEIHIVDLRTAVPKRNWLGFLFGYGDLILTDKDDKKIIYSWISEHKFIARYLSRIVDYIKINGHTDDLSAYKKRKIRNQEKNSQNKIPN